MLLESFHFLRNRGQLIPLKLFTMPTSLSLSRACIYAPFTDSTPTTTLQLLLPEVPTHRSELMAEERRTEDLGDGEDVISLCNHQIDGYESEDSSLSRGCACTPDDVLSLCNLRIDGYESEDSSLRRGRPSTASDQDAFEFFANPGGGEVVEGDGDSEKLNEFRKRDYFCVRSASFRRIRNDYSTNKDREYASPSMNRSSSVRSSGSDPSRSSRISPVQKVNITALTSMSEKSRRRMFMFGPVKFRPEMDVNAIRRRQCRVPPTQIPSIPEENEIVAARGSGEKGKGGVSDGLPRPLWYRSHLAAALARSVACGSASMV